MVDLSLELLSLLDDLTGTTNHQLRSDLAIAALLAEAAARAAAWNVRINLPQLEDAQERDRRESSLAKRLQRAESMRARVEAAMKG